MNGAIPGKWPYGAAQQRAGRTMDVTLHLGVHRTGSTTFQSYLRRNAQGFRDKGVGFWGPRRTRKGLFAGVLPVPGVASGRDLQRRAKGRVQLQLERSAKSGIQTLMVSDENLIGSVRDNLRQHMLYPAIGDRMARFAHAFDGRIKEIVLNVRSHDHYWASAASYGVCRGHALPAARALQAISESTRTWRDVIVDLSCAVPDAAIWVLPFEEFAGRPDAMFRAGTGIAAPRDTAHEWLNRAPTVANLRDTLLERGIVPHFPQNDTERWQPFDDDQRAALREAYADDLQWLMAGADGTATLTEDPGRKRAGPIPSAGSQTRGHDRHDQQERNLAQSG